MPPNHFESEVESFLEGSHGDRTHIKRADHHTVTPLCGTLLAMAGTKFSLLGFCALRAVQNSPCLCILGKNRRLFPRWESFVPGWVCDGGCWESFVPGSVCDGGCWESCVPGRAFSDAVGFTVMTSLCSGREKVRPVRSEVNANAKKFAQRGKIGLKIAVYGVLGELFRARAQMGLVLGEFFCVRAEMGLVLGDFFRARAQMGLVLGDFFARGPRWTWRWASIFAQRA